MSEDREIENSNTQTLNALQSEVVIAKAMFNDLNQVIDTQGNMKSLTGWGAKDFVGHLAAELFHPEDIERLEALLVRSQPEAALQPATILRIQHAELGWRPIEVIINAQQDNAPFTLAFTGYPEGVLQAEAAAIANTTKRTLTLQQRFEHLSSTIVFDRRFQHVWSNPAFLEFFNLDQTELGSISLAEWLHRFNIKAEDSASRPLSLETLSTDPAWQGEVTADLAGIEQLFFLVSERLFIDDLEGAVVLQLFDRSMTSVKERPDEVIATAIKALAIELRNAMGVISGHATLLGETLANANIVSPSVPRLEEFTEHVIDLLAPLTALAYLNEDQQLSFSPITALTDLSPLLFLLSHKRFLLDADTARGFICDGNPSVFDRGILATVISADSALKADGKIRLKVKTTHDQLTLNFEFEGLEHSHLLESQIDNPQHRVSAAKVAKQFAPLFALKTAFDGSIQTTLSSNGLMLKLSLPGKSTSESMQAEGQKVRTIRQALLIEDDEGVSDLVALFLGSLGMDVTCCSSEQEVHALEHYDFDLIVSDVMLASGKTGPLLVRSIREQQPDLPCLFISGYKHGALSEEDLAQSKTAFLAKPFSKASFTTQVQALLKGADTLGQPTVP